MRTKSLVVAVALLSGAIGSSLAQVYSVNIVGYINLKLNPGLNLIVNQLASDTDDLNSFMPSAPDGTVAFRFDPAAQAYLDGVTFLDGIGWYPASGRANDPIKSIPLGEGFFVHIPGSTGTTVTFVGEVALNSTNRIPGNYSLKGSIIPQAASLGDLEFIAADGDAVYQWDALLQRFNAPSAYLEDSQAWQPGEPNVVVGEGFLLFRNPALATPDKWWIRHYSVGPAPPPGPAPLIAFSPAPPPVIRRLSLPPGKVTLDVSNPSAQPYNVQFSRDGIAWNTLATRQTTAQWTAPFAAGDGGYFRLSQGY